MNKDTGQLCPTCQTGQDTYLLDSKNPFCPYLHCHNGTSCTMYKPIMSEPSQNPIGQKLPKMDIEFYANNVRGANVDFIKNIVAIITISISSQTL